MTLFVLCYIQEFAEPYTLILLDCLNEYREKFNEKASRLEPDQLTVVSVIATCLVLLIGKCLSSFWRSEESLWKRTKRVVFRTVISLPIIKGFASKEIDKTVF